MQRKTNDRMYGALLSLVAVLPASCRNIPDQRGARQAETKEMDTAGNLVPRQIEGLRLGMTVKQVPREFNLTEDADPVAKLLTKYGKPDAANDILRTNKDLKKKFFHVDTKGAHFPQGVDTADARFADDVLYEIGLHYDEGEVRRAGWQGITFPYIAKYGRPTKDTGSAYIWDDGRTRLEIESSGRIVNVFYTDVVLMELLSRSEREHR